jgi:hypothetical protein
VAVLIFPPLLQANPTAEVEVALVDLDKVAHREELAAPVELE